MVKIKRSNEQWMTLLQDCRSSGLTDRAWCALNDIHPTTFYRAIKRLRTNACQIPEHSPGVTSLPQEVVEVASIDENGILSMPQQSSPSMLKAYETVASLDSTSSDNKMFDATVRIITPSGFRIELNNHTDAATIKSLFGALQSV